MLGVWLYHEAYFGNVGALKRAARRDRESLRGQTASGNTLAHIAAINCHLEVMAFLEAHDLIAFALDITNEEGDDPIMTCIKYGRGRHVHACLSILAEHCTPAQLAHRRRRASAFIGIRGAEFLAIVDCMLYMHSGGEPFVWADEFVNEGVARLSLSDKV
jgi:hypothetical protein